MDIKSVLLKLLVLVIGAVICITIDRTLLNIKLDGVSMWARAVHVIIYMSWGAVVTVV
jgi:hypothetical protein